MSVATTTNPMTFEAILSLAGELLEHDRWSRERLLSYQAERLRALLRHVLQRSPYYREALGADAADGPLASLPTLPKSLLWGQFDGIVTDPRLRRSDLEAFLAEADAGASYLDRYRVFTTGGTTGEPGIFVYSPAEFAHWIAVSLAALARVGVTPATRFVAIGAPSPIHITRQLFAAFQAGRADVPSLSVSTPLEEIVVSLNAYRPEAMLAYAGFLGVLADEQLNGRLDIRPRLVIGTSEVLTDDVVCRVEEAWDTRPINAYAATEAPPIATGSLDDVGMHVWENSAIVEVVDEAGRHVAPGEPGSKVLLTNLVNLTQPLIRYELSDSAVLEEEPDPSGRPWLRIARVDGRSDDILALPARGGGEVRVHPHRLRAPFGRIQAVRLYQVVHRPDGLFVRIVPGADAPSNLPEQVRVAMSEALVDAGAEVPVRVEPVAELEREPGPGAKLRLVRSEM
jgi:phenylacetate-CoA ligase